MNHVNSCDLNASVTLEITHQSQSSYYSFRWLLLSFARVVDMHFIWWIRVGLALKWWVRKVLKFHKTSMLLLLLLFNDSRFDIKSKLKENLINLFTSVWYLNFYTVQHMYSWNSILFNLCIEIWYFVRYRSRWKALNAFSIGIHLVIRWTSDTKTSKWYYHLKYINDDQYLIIVQAMERTMNRFNSSSIRMKMASILSYASEWVCLQENCCVANVT